MRIFGKVGEAVPEPETAAAEPTEPTDDDADTIRTRAEQARAEAHKARTEAETLVATARAQAARLVAEAEQQARALAGEAQDADRRAEKLEDRVSYFVHADMQRDRAAEAQQQASDLEGEADDLREQVDEIAAKLEKFAAQREDATAALTTARNHADVAGVTAQRAQLAAIDEVVGVLDGQRQQAVQRIQAIGDPEGIGELAKVLEQAQTARAEQRRLENLLYPDSQQAQTDRLLEDLQGALEAEVAKMTAGQKPAQHNIIRTNQEPPMAVRKTASIRKAKADAADMVACYDVNGNLVGICPQDVITPIADAAEAEPLTKSMLAEAGPAQQVQVANALNTAAVRKFQQIRGTGR